MILRKIFVAAFLLTLSLSADAQLEKGKYSINAGVSSRIIWGVGGDLLLLDNYTFGAGYFIKDRLEVGLKGDFHYLNGTNYSRKDYSLGAYSKYYFTKKKRFTPYVEGSLGGGRATSILENHFILDRRFLKASLGIGADYWITKKFALTAGVQLDQNFFFDNLVPRSGQLNFNIGAKFNF